LGEREVEEKKKKMMMRKMQEEEEGVVRGTIFINTPRGWGVCG
jgi:hypothetical protein